jgi:hypothetical protein
MDPVIKQILHSSLTINLPPVFIVDAKDPTSKKRKKHHPSRTTGSKEEGQEVKGQRQQQCSFKAHQKQSHDNRIQNEGRRRLASRSSRQEHQGQAQVEQQVLNVCEVVYQERLLHRLQQQRKPLQCAKHPRQEEDRVPQFPQQSTWEPYALTPQAGV